MDVNAMNTDHYRFLELCYLGAISKKNHILINSLCVVVDLWSFPLSCCLFFPA